MSERSEAISRLSNEFEARTSYIRAKLGVLVPSKIRALRLKSNMPRQRDLAIEADMHQSRISMFETPGAANVTLETLAKLAAAFRMGLVVDFVPFSQMLRWENNYSQDTFDVTRIDDDVEFTRLKAEPVASLTLSGHFGNVSAASTVINAFANGNTAGIIQNPGIATLLSKAESGGEVMSYQQVQAAGGR
jgi:transcriptional regulator with XRE-family HTH domain